MVSKSLLGTWLYSGLLPSSCPEGHLQSFLASSTPPALTSAMVLLGITVALFGLVALMVPGMALCHKYICQLVPRSCFMHVCWLRLQASVRLGLQTWGALWLLLFAIDSHI